MINKISLVLLAFLLVFSAKVSAIEVGQAKAEEKAQIKTQVTAQANASATGTAKSQSAAATTGNATSTSAKAGKSQGDEHKSAVALLVKNLLAVADRDGGIGAEVRLVAQEQASTSEKVKTDMDVIYSESKLKVFLFGPSYKNLGDLRSTIVTTESHIDRLKKAEERATSATVKADLQAQIDALEDISVNTEAFVEANENKFSALGWLVRIFSN